MNLDHHLARMSDPWQPHAATDAHRHATRRAEWVPNRPLVVIDPEDAKQVDRLANLMDWALHSDDTPRLQAALREFARPTPPKPEEPTGLGAVVEDMHGDRWVRFPDFDDDDAPWVHHSDESHPRHGDCESWTHIAAVRVLSPGVEADA